MSAAVDRELVELFALARAGAVFGIRCQGEHWWVNGHWPGEPKNEIAICAVNLTQAVGRVCDYLRRTRQGAA